MKTKHMGFSCGCVVALCCLWSEAALHDLPPLQSWNSGSRKTLVEELLNPGTDVKASTEEMKEWLLGNNSTSRIRQPGWVQVLRLYQWQVIRGKVDGLASETWRWLMSDADLTEDFFQNLNPQDNQQKALEILQAIHRAAPECFPKFNSLAIAYAIVWDQPPSPYLHRQIGEAKIPMDGSTSVERFLFYVDGNANAALEWDLSKLKADCLKFVVDAVVSLDELRWAQKNVRTSRSKFESVFPSVTYDTQRIVAQQFVWLGPDYTLADIAKKGGICVDQAYYAAMAGKARGIPTLLFSGSGRRGGHAWFGFLRAMDKWELDCGRYAYDKYATGTARDPQTGMVISDHELDFLSKRFRDQPSFQLSELMLAAAKLQAEADFAAVALSITTEAITIEPRNYDAWVYREGLFRASKNMTGLKTQFETIMQRFASYPDIKVETQKKLADLYEDAGKTNEARKLTASIIRQNTADRCDLGIEMIQENIQKEMEANDFDGALHDFKAALRRFAKETGPVMSLLNMFVKGCIDKKQVNVAAEALSLAKRSLTRDPTTQRAFDRVEKKLDAARRGVPQTKTEWR